MRRLAPLTMMVVLLAVPACSSGKAKQVVDAGQASPTGAPATTIPVPTTAAPPHFTTPEAAMRYLATAWNARDLVSLRHVTDPAARAQLDAMHGEATNLRLDHCIKRPQGDYECTFAHDYPAATPTTMAGGVGQAIFLVGPADTPGWYMTVFESCG